MAPNDPTPMNPSPINPYASPQAAASVPSAPPAPLRYATSRPGAMLGFGLILGCFFGGLSGAFISATLGFAATATLAPPANHANPDTDLDFNHGPVEVAFFGGFLGGFFGAGAGAVVGLIVGVVCGVEQFQSKASWWTAALLSAAAAGAFGAIAGAMLNSELRLLAPPAFLGAACAAVAGVGGFAAGVFLSAMLRNVAARWRRVESPTTSVESALFG